MPIAVIAALALLGALLPAGAAPGAQVTGEGVVRSEERIELKSKVAAPIRRIAAREGEVLRAGDLLVELVNDQERAQVEAAEAEIKRAESAVADADLTLAVAERELKRNLEVEDLITGKELERSRDAVRSAAQALSTRREELARARAMLAVAQAAYEATLLRAQFDGVVSRIYLHPGATPKPAETTILDFATLDRLYVEIALPMTFLRSVRPGQAASVEVEADDARARTMVPGQVTYVYPDVDPTIRMFRVKVGVPRRDFTILPGMLARVRVQLASSAGK